MKKAMIKTFLIVNCAVFSLTRFDDYSFLFLNTYFNVLSRDGFVAFNFFPSVV